MDSDGNAVVMLIVEDAVANERADVKRSTQKCKNGTRGRHD